MSNSQIEQQTRQRNRKKLLQQNMRLHTQLTKLQKEIELLEDTLSTQKQQQQNFSQLKSQIQMQQKQIRQLKQVVDAGRQSNAKENVYYIKKQQDELLCFKQQLQRLLIEKEVVSRAHQDKLTKLAANEPLLKHKEELQKSWNQTKKENRQTSLKLVQLQREIRKFHNLKQMSKNNNGINSSEQIELANLESEIARMTSQMKIKQLKWKPNGEVLDNQFFSKKNTIQIMHKKIEQLQKQEGVLKVRAAALRDESQIKTDRIRLSKIVSITKPEPLIKIPSSAPKQQIKKPTLQMILQKQIRNSVKNDKFVDLVRVQSTPSASSSLKKSIQLQPIQTQGFSKKKNKQQITMPSPKNAKPIAIPISQPSNIQKPQNKKLQKKQKNKKDQLQKQGSKEIFKVQVAQQNKNGSNWVGRREKIKSKQANAVALAQIIQKKAEQVKQINKKLQKEQKERSVSSPKKKRAQMKSLERVESQINLKRSIDKVKTKQIKDQSFSKIAAKQSVSKISQQKKQRQNNQMQKKQAIKEKNPSKQSKQLVQKIDISAKLNSFPTNPSSKNKLQKKIQPVQEKIREKEPAREKRKQKIQQAKPHSPSEHQKPIFEIFMKDNSSKIRLSQDTHIKNPDLDDAGDGIPKIIKRKIKPEGQLVTTGTST